MLFYGAEKMEFTDVIQKDTGYLLLWEKREGVSGYQIYRKRIGNDGYDIVTTLDEHVTQFHDVKPPLDDAYEYQIYAVIEGDFMIGEPDAAGGQDFALTQDHQAAEQDLRNRLRSQKGEWRSHPELGADLELLEGEPNTRETGERGVEQIHEALTYDGRFLSEDLEIRAVPTSIEQIDFYTILDSEDDEPIIVRQPLNI